MTEDTDNSQINQPENNIDAVKDVLDIQKQEQNIKAKESFFKSYFWSVLLPPIGIYYFVKYYFFSDKSPRNRRAAVINLVLTVLSLIGNIWGIYYFLNQPFPGSSQDLNSIKELANPENQKSLQQLLQ